MPSVSQAQRGAMASAAEGKSKLGIPAKVGQEFMDADEGGKLPARAPAPKPKLKPKSKDTGKADLLAKQGLISPKQMAKAKGSMKSEREVDDEIETSDESGGSLVKSKDRT